MRYSRMCRKLDTNCMFYSSTNLGSSLIMSVFNFYYVYYFIEVYNISPYWFQLSQIVFMVWNAVNDPLFGWFQDNSSIAWLKSRQLNILYGAPVFAISFMLPWLPFGEVFGGTGASKGLHLMVSLCFWDTLLSFVLIAHCALFTEITETEQGRIDLTLYTRVATLLSFWAVPFVELFITLFGSTGLYISTTVLAVASCFLMCLTGLFVRTDVNRDVASGSKTEDQASICSYQYLKLNCQILSNTNFLSFVAMNFLTVGMSMFASNFTKVFVEDMNLFGDIPSYRIIFFLVASLGGNGMILLLGPCLKLYGTHIVVMLSFIFIMLSSGVVWVFQSRLLIGSQLLVINIVPSGMFGLFNIFVSDIIDEDYARHERKLPLSSMVFGLNALLTKPAQSIFPMIAVQFLASSHSTGGRSSESIMNLLCILPFITALLQLIVFSAFRFKHLQSASGSIRLDTSSTLGDQGVAEDLMIQTHRSPSP